MVRRGHGSIKRCSLGVVVSFFNGAEVNCMSVCSFSSIFGPSVSCGEVVEVRIAVSCEGS